MKIDVCTSAGPITVIVDDADVIGPFAVHAVLPPTPDDAPCFGITHIASGQAIWPFREWVWGHKEGALEFARELASVWTDSDVEQGIDGVWRATTTGVAKFKSVRSKLGYNEKLRKAGG